MAKNDRIGRLIAILQEKNGASIRELAGALNVTEMTIRRDLKMLSGTGKINLVRGVAIYRPNQDETDRAPYNLQTEQHKNTREKERIGSAAAALVEPGDVIFLDMGTTSTAVAKHIPQNMQITVLCFSVNTMTEIQQKNVAQLIMSGGFYHKDTQTFECAEMMKMMRSRRATKAFIVPAGVSMPLGLTCNSPYEVDIKKMGLDNALEKILLLDSSKFGRVSASCFGDWDQIDKVITDEGITEEWKAFFQERNIELIIA